jgi:hypothetical protein
MSLAVVQTSSAQLLGGKGEVKLYLDGVLKETGPMPYHQSRKETFLDCRIARGRDAAESIALNPNRAGSTSLRAQLANVHVFDPLTAEQINSVFRLGIHYVGCFDACTLMAFKQNHTLDQVVHGLDDDGSPEAFFDSAPPDALTLKPTGLNSSSSSKADRIARKGAKSDSLAARKLLEQPISDLLHVMYPAQLARNGQIRNQAYARRHPQVCVGFFWLCLLSSVLTVVTCYFAA